MTRPLNLPDPTICDMNCFFKPDHEGPHQFDPDRFTWEQEQEMAYTVKLNNGKLIQVETEGPTVYLGGPMSGCSLEEMTGWRNELKAKWATEFNFRDPCDREYTPQKWRQLVDDDIADIDASDFVLCYMWKPGIGSSMELVEARYRRKPTIVVIPDFKYVSPWVRAYADFLVEDFDHAYKILIQTWPNAVEGGVHHP